MDRNEIILVVCSVIGSAFAFALPLLSLIWKAFNVIGDLRLQLAQSRSDLNMTRNQLEHIDERWEAVSGQTLQRFEHFSTRLKGEVEQLHSEVREVQQYLSKTTSFEVRNR